MPLFLKMTKSRSHKTESHTSYINLKMIPQLKPSQTMNTVSSSLMVSWLTRHCFCASIGESNDIVHRKKGLSGVNSW